MSVLKNHEQLLAQVSQAAASALPPADAAAWFRQQGATKLSNRLRSAVRRRNDCALPEVALDAGSVGCCGS